MLEQTYAAGDIIFREGDPSELAYVLGTGMVAITRAAPEGEVVLAELKAGAIFGEMGLVDERPRSASATAVSAVTLGVMSREHFLYTIHHDPSKALDYLHVLFERLRMMNARVYAAEQSQSAVTPDTVIAPPDPSITQPTPSEKLPPTELVAPLEPPMLKAASSLAEQLVPEMIAVDDPPYRIGRASKYSEGIGRNDLILPDRSPYTVSRYHLAIDQQRGHWVICDRGSYLGTIVNGEPIGGRRRSGIAMLNVGENTIIVGDSTSPYRFTLILPSP